MSTAFRVILTGDQEVPPRASAANGSGIVIFDSAAVAANYSFVIQGFDFGRITGGLPQTPDPLDDVTRIHFHTAAQGVNGPIVFGQIDPAQDNDDLALVLGADGFLSVSGRWETTDPANVSITNFASVLGSAAVGTAIPLYFNVHSNEFPGGEIRGQLVAIANDIDNVVTGTAGNDVLRGLRGNDAILGFAGDDKIEGGRGNDVLDGGAGNDDIDGGKGNDILEGSAGNDDLDGDDGDDVLNGGAGNDELEGGKGDDKLDGGTGNDELEGDKGDDELNGGAGNDELEGGKGNDTVNGGTGNDDLTGGDGRDLFVFNAGFGMDIISDFEHNDRIQFEDGLFQNFQSVLTASRQVGSDTVITLDQNNTLTLEDVRLSSLNANDFLFLA